MNKFWKITNEADSESAEILLYGRLASSNYWDDDATVTAKAFRNDLQALGGKDVTVRINSPGGEVMTAQAIYNLLKSYTGKVSVHIDGLCASAATLVACAGSHIAMPRNALYMIHNPATYAGGNADDLRKCADTLDKFKDIILNVYEERTGRKRNDISKAMDAETWMTADEALANGYVDEIDDYGVSASMDGSTLVVNNVKMPYTGPHLEELRKMIDKKGVKPMAKSEDLLSKIRALLGMEEPKAVKEPVKAEPEEPEQPKQPTAEELEALRIQALDGMKTGTANVDQFIETAKSHGMTADDAKAYLPSLQNADNVMAQLSALIKDEMESGAQAVQAGQSKAEPEDTAEMARQKSINDVVARMNKMKGAK